MEIITDRSISVAFFTLVLFASTWYYIKVKQQANKSKNKYKEVLLSKHMSLEGVKRELL